MARRGVRVRATALGWREIRTAPALTLSTAPALLSICVVAGTRPGALTVLILITLLRAGIAVAIELRYVRDGSTLRALARLPLLWFAEPFLLLFGRSRAPELDALSDGAQVLPSANDE